MKQRQSGLDLLRCLGMFFVVGVHSFLNNGFYYEEQMGVSIWFANSFRWLFFICNGIFLILTGYLKSTAPWNRRYYRSLVAVLVGYVLTCVISFPIRHFLLDEKLSFVQWVQKMITFGNYAWYVEMYLGLFLLSPLINLALEKMQTPRQLMIIAGSLVCISALPSITAANIVPDYWTSVYPVTYYVLGAVIRRLQPKCKTWLCLLGVAAIAMGLGFVTMMTAAPHEGFSSGFGQGYGGFWVTCMVVLLFLALYRLRIPQLPARVLGWMAGGCFEGYILSRLLDVWVYARFPQWHKPEMYPVLFVCVTIPIFLLSLLAGKATNYLARRISKPLCRWLRLE